MRDTHACPVCRARCAPADVWLLYVANEVQPDTVQLRERLGELGQLVEQEKQLQLAAEQRGAQLRTSGRAVQQQCDELLRQLQRRSADGGATSAPGSRPSSLPGSAAPSQEVAAG